jgi:anti-anti-sigma factor
MAELGSQTPAELTIERSLDEDGAPVLALGGELDISNAPALRGALASVTEEKPSRLTFDLKELRFMDSAGVAVLITAAREVDDVHLRDPSPIVRRVIELTGLSGVLPTER